ncbi:hypothetical protein PanWU01x14_132330 [Parasponia andersonii]|uniref:Transmembrane protein n=1 Tax=Parasponia andersonii TaxID=3476 RepID=A0A2P5CQN9_PARAD|nr:hypothetical protein PanWU01x14_132330 [Parasponia andersonii]
MERKNVHFLVAVAIVFLVATLFVSIPFTEADMELRSDELAVAKWEMPYPLSNVFIEDNNLGLQFCGICRLGVVCDKGCICTWNIGWLVPVCKGLCC